MIQLGKYGGGLSAINYGGGISVLENAVIFEDNGVGGFQFADGSFVQFGDGSTVEAPNA